MAQNMLGQVNLEFVNKTKATATSGGDTSGLATPVNYSSVSAMRTRLAAANAYYTAAVLDNMTVNDMVYALRTIDDAGTL
jgi:hypothetical protein